MKKRKRILALLGVIFLVLLYLSTLIFALLKNDTAATLLRVSVALTILLPCMLYSYLLIYRLVNKKEDEEQS